MNRIRTLENRKIELIRNIQLCQEYKNSIINFVKERNREHAEQLISYEEYRSKLSTVLKDRTAKQWIRYYDDLISNYHGELGRLREEVKLEDKSKNINQVALIVGLLGIGLLLLFLAQPKSIGFTIFNPNEQLIEDIYFKDITEFMPNTSIVKMTLDEKEYEQPITKFLDDLTSYTDENNETVYGYNVTEAIVNTEEFEINAPSEDGEYDLVSRILDGDRILSENITTIEVKSGEVEPEEIIEEEVNETMPELNVTLPEINITTNATLSVNVSELAKLEDSFRANDNPVFYIKNKGEANIKEKFKAIEGLKIKGRGMKFNNEELNINLVDVLGSDISDKVSIERGEDGSYRITLERPREFRGGKYHIDIRYFDGTEWGDFGQDFEWGVLAVNFDKSIYLFGDKSDIGIGVLDEKGKMVCSADLVLSIKDPSGNITTLTTENGDIKVSGECEIYGVTSLPDFYTEYDTSEIGNYTVLLTATTPNGIKSIKDGFSVRNNVSFDVKRSSATRIYPPVSYRTNITVKANENYNGFIEEYVPSSFTILDSNADTVDTVDDARVIRWNVDLNIGDVKELYYVYDAPDISPELFLAGALRIGEFEETREWMIASDQPSAQSGRWVFLNGTRTIFGENIKILNNSNLNSAVATPIIASGTSNKEVCWDTGLQSNFTTQNFTSTDQPWINRWYVNGTWNISQQFDCSASQATAHVHWYLKKINTTGSWNLINGNGTLHGSAGADMCGTSNVVQTNETTLPAYGSNTTLSQGEEIFIRTCIHNTGTTSRNINQDSEIAPTSYVFIPNYTNIDSDNYPDWFFPMTNETLVYKNTYVNFSTFWALSRSTTIGLTVWQFSLDQEGGGGNPWVNATPVSFGGVGRFEANSTNVSYIYASPGTNVTWIFVANSSNGAGGFFANITNYQSFIVADRLPTADIAAIEPQSITEAGVTNVTFNMDITDEDGFSDILSGNVSFNRDGEIKRTNSSCVFNSNINTTTDTYQCTVPLWWFDGPGTWYVNATVYDQLGNWSTTGEEFTVQSTTAVQLGPTSLLWPTIGVGGNFTSNNDPVLLNNTGNANVSSGKIQVTGYDLVGETTNTYFIGAGNFTVDIDTGAEGASGKKECSSNATAGAVMLNKTAVNITGAFLNRGNFTINDNIIGQEQLYFCLNGTLSGVTNQAYSTLINWTILVSG